MAGTHDIARDSGMKDTEIKTMLNSILARVKNGERVVLKDFGSFELKHVKERMIKSPQIPNGEAKVEAHDVIKFRPAPHTKAVLNGQAELATPSAEPEETPAPKAAPKAAAAPKATAPAKPAAAKPAPAAAKAPAAAPKAAAPAKAPAPAAKKPAPKPAPVVEETEATE